MQRTIHLSIDRERRVGSPRWLLALLFAVLPVSYAGAQQVEVMPDGVPLPAGNFMWRGGGGYEESDGPVRIMVSLGSQTMRVYRGDALIGATRISSGAPGRGTPVGVFAVRGKSRMHYSRKYDDAPMPYSLWITSGGVAIHAGDITMPRDTHGCISVPPGFARRLFEITPTGTRVVITNEGGAPDRYVRGGPDRDDAGPEESERDRYARSGPDGEDDYEAEVE